jgi:prophage regulatory protein
MTNEETHPNQEKPKRLLRLPDVVKKTGIPPATIHKKEREGKFPKRVRLGERSSAWFEHEIENWMESLRNVPLGKPIGIGKCNDERIAKAKAKQSSKVAA